MRYGTPYSRVLSPRWVFFQQVGVMLQYRVVPYLIFYSESFLVIFLTILVSVAYHIVRDVCWESNRSKRYGQLACSTCVLPEATPSKMGAEVDEGGFVEAAHSSVVEVIIKYFT
jgi:hypothetical protein